MSGFSLNLGVVKQGHSRVRLAAAARELDLPEGEWPGEVQAELDVQRNGEKLALQGTVSAAAQLECVRCLRPFEHPFEVELTVYADRSGTSRRDEQDDLERDHVMKFHDGRQLDLGEETREALLIELPITPRCSEDCKGLCPRCGADLNQGPCGCSAQS